MRIFPTTNRIEQGSSIESPTLNEALREVYEVGNGSFTEKNIKPGDATYASGNGLVASNFADNAWQEYFSFGGAVSPTAFTISPTNSSNADIPFVFYDSGATRYGAGFVSGQTQIKYDIAMNLRNNLTAMGIGAGALRDCDWAALNTKHRFAVEINGQRVGESEMCGEGPKGYTNIPFYFYHPGGPIQLRLLIEAPSYGEAANKSESYRFKVNRDYTFGIIRKR